MARERLQILLEYERKLGSQIDLFTVLREEILAVVSRHVVDPEKIQVTVDRRAKFSTLAVDIEIPNIGGEARILPTDCPVLRRDKTVGARGLSVVMPGVDAAAGTFAVPIWLAEGAVAPFVEAIMLAAKSAGGVALTTSLFRVGLIAAVVLGCWLYVQPPMRDRGAAEPASQSAAVTPPGALGSATSSPQEPPLRESVTVPSQEQPPPGDPATAEPAAPSAPVTPPAVLGSITSPPLRGSVTVPSSSSSSMLRRNSPSRFTP